MENSSITPTRDPILKKALSLGLGMKGGVQVYFRVGPVTTGKRTGNHAWRELGALTVPKLCPACLGPGGVRQGSWPTATHGLGGPAPRPLALFDRGAGL